MRYFGIGVPIEGVLQNQLLVKGAVILAMTGESLCNHIFGPGRAFKDKGAYIAGKGHAAN